MKWFKFFAAAILIAALPLVAQAQQNSQSGSLSGATSGSSAGSEANIYEGNSNAIYPQNTPAPTAPAFVTASPCMGVISGAGTSPVVGIALGMSYKDKECELRANASALNSMGARAAAIQIMCQLKDVAAAMKAAGTPCSGIVVEAAATLPPRPVEDSEAQPTGQLYGMADRGIAKIPNEKEAFCKSLDPANPQDRPYISTDCKTY
jgi:hypothetical protein